ncbi:helix-turn-helix transcriptional regulator [Gloeocapsopsis dulcis]|nr:helix-turn-helix transcriptional regulator [Gloeocapsopsis dulcis]WNN92117.1 helix-turn-helix transcriptional regulator [Gloeocapsopsis dulcis]
MKDYQRQQALADFLRSRRARLSPEEVGLPSGGRRRTPGLRREEVAQLADVGTAWYTWLEQGRDINVSEAVLDRIADALRLTMDERLHLLMLAQRQFPTPPPLAAEAISPILQHLLDNQEASPAYITGRYCNILAWNQIAAAVFSDFSALSVEERNMLWLVFTKAEYRQLFVDWERFAQDLLAMFRYFSVRYVDDSWYKQYITALIRVSPEFEQWWQRHDVRTTFEQKRELAHPVVGRLVLNVTTLHVNGDPDLKLCVYTALPGSNTSNKLHQLFESRCRGVSSNGHVAKS